MFGWVRKSPMETTSSGYQATGPLPMPWWLRRITMETGIVCFLITWSASCVRLTAQNLAVCCVNSKREVPKITRKKLQINSLPLCLYFNKCRLNNVIFVIARHSLTGKSWTVWVSYPFFLKIRKGICQVSVRKAYCEKLNCVVTLLVWKV